MNDFSYPRSRYSFPAGAQLRGALAAHRLFNPPVEAISIPAQPGTQQKKQRRETARPTVAHQTHTSAFDKALNNLLPTLQKERLDAEAALPMEEKSLADDLFERVSSVINGRNLKCDGREWTCLLLYIAGRLYNEVDCFRLTEEDVKVAARRVREWNDENLTRMLVQGLLVIRRMFKNGIMLACEKEDLKMLISCISSHPLAEIYGTDTKFLQKIRFTDACIMVRWCLFVDQKFGVDMGWFVKIWKEVRDVAKLNLSEPAHMRAIQHVAFVSGNLLKDSSLNLLDSIPFTACVNPKIAKRLGHCDITRPLQRTDYLRIVKAHVCKCCQGALAFEIHAKAHLMMAEEALAVEKPYFEPSTFRMLHPRLSLAQIALIAVPARCSALRSAEDSERERCGCQN